VILLLAYDGVDELDLVGAYSVLSKAGNISGPADFGVILNVKLIGTSNLIKTAGSITLSEVELISELTLADAVIVPGGRGASAAAEDPRIQTFMKGMQARGVPVFSICSGALIVARAGLAYGKRIAIHHDKKPSLSLLAVGEIASGLVTDQTLCSVGGDISMSVKSVDIAFEVLARFAPHTIGAVSKRMELYPGRCGDASTMAESVS